MDMAAINARLIEEYRSGAELSLKGMHRERIVLLTTTGKRSGEPRTAPMMFQPTDRGILVIASANGSPRTPHWFGNLVADPAVHVEAPDDEYDASARVLQGEERAAAWAELLEDFPFFAEHQQRAGREIPLVELVRST